MVNRHFCAVTALLAIGAVGVGRADAQAVSLGPWQAATPAQTHENFVHFVDGMRAGAERVAPQATAPSIVSGQILTPSFSVAVAPGSPEIMLKIKPGDSIVSNIEVELVSPSGKRTIYTYAEVPSYPPLQGNGTSYTISLGATFNSEAGFNLYTEPGSWTISSITLATASGTPTTYSSAQLAAILPSITIDVQNPGQADVVAPKLAGGKVLTPSVSLSGTNPMFETRFGVSDALSGLRFIQMILIGPNGSDRLFANTVILAPLNKGVAFALTPIYQGTATGTWTIFGLQYCDVAGNCGYQSSPSEIQALLGTTTFQITD